MLSILVIGLCIYGLADAGFKKIRSQQRVKL
jgi:hypothetical protein